MLINMVALPMWLEKDINGYPILMVTLSIVAIPLLLLEYFYTRERITEDVATEVGIDHENKIPLDDDAPFFKPEGFIEERETRFCFVRIIQPDQMEKPKPDSHLKDVQFHVSNTAIVPHYELSLADEIGTIIREITTGPRNDSDERVIKTFLAKNEFNLEKIDVKHSQIPYRVRK